MDKSFTVDELEWVGVRFLDPIGRVFKYAGDYYRAIYKEKVAEVQYLFDCGIIADLVSEGLFLPIEITDYHVEGYGMVLKTKGATWSVEPYTFTFSTLKEAALAWIRINRLLQKSGLCLIDAHHGNYILTGKSEPMWIDLGSIQPLNNANEGIGEFMHCQLLPIGILRRNKQLNRVVRLIIKNGGLNFKECLGITGFSLTGLKLTLLYYMVRIVGRLGRKTRLNVRLFRYFILHYMEQFIINANFIPQKGFWSDYRSNSDIEVDPDDIDTVKKDTRPAKVVELIKQAEPVSIIDVGANDGYFSILASPYCKRILATDTDEFAIEKFVDWVRKTAENGEYIGCVSNFNSIKHKANLVLGLAVVHHISISQRYKFDVIARRFAQMTNDVLITEFMPNGLGSNQVYPDPLPEYYTLDKYIAELKKYFREVKVVDYERPASFSPRILIFCRYPNL